MGRLAFALGTLVVLTGSVGAAVAPPRKKPAPPGKMAAPPKKGVMPAPKPYVPPFPGPLPVHVPPAGVQAVQLLPTVSPEQAAKAFALMAAHTDIAYTYPIDGCYSRAHLMCQRLQKLGYRPGKVWAFANGASLHARTPHDPRGHIEWDWHVAPILQVLKSDGALEEMVIDPSLFSTPVSVDRWRASMRRGPTGPQPYIFLTRLGEAPVRPVRGRMPGTGYWSSADPSKDLDGHAVGVMKRYQGIADAR